MKKEKDKEKKPTSMKPPFSSLGEHKLFSSDKSLVTITYYSVSEQTSAGTPL